MKLKDWRKGRKLTMEAAGEILGLSQASLSRIEAGKQWPDRPTMERIQTATDGAVAPNDFIHEPSEVGPPATPEPLNATPAQDFDFRAPRKGAA